MIPLAVITAGLGTLLVLAGLRGETVGQLLSDALSGAGVGTGADAGAGTSSKPAGTSSGSAPAQAGNPVPDRKIAPGAEGVDDRGDGTSTSLADLDPQLSRPLDRLLRDARAQGYNVTIYSGRRTWAKQNRLWQQALRDYGSPDVADDHVGTPWGSRHVKGLAADLDYGPKATAKQAREWVHANASRYGLWFRLANEDWHIEPRSIR